MSRAKPASPVKTDETKPPVLKKAPRDVKMFAIMRSFTNQPVYPVPWDVFGASEFVIVVPYHRSDIVVAFIWLIFVFSGLFCGLANKINKFVGDDAPKNRSDF